MVKLIRLTSTNNGIFNTNFDSEILLNPNSKIALLNATFETVFDNVNITSTNNLISFRAETNGVTTSFRMPPKSYYGKEGTQEFLDDLAVALNSTLKATKVTPPVRNLFSEFSVNNLFLNNEEDKTKISYQYVPLCTPLGPMWTAELTRRTRNIPFWTATPDKIDIDDTTKLDNITQLTAGTARTLNENYNYITNKDFPLSRGNALFSATVYDFNDNASGIEDNGFAIGLTQTDLSSLGYPKNENIPGTSRELEIRFTRDDTSYKYIDDNGFEKEAVGAIPERTGTVDGIQNNDTMFFRIGQSSSPGFEGKRTVTGGIWKCAPVSPFTAVEQILFERVLTDVENKGDWFPYMYIRGASTEIKVANLQYTPSLKSINADRDPYETYKQVFGLADGQIPASAFRQYIADDSSILSNVWQNSYLGAVTPDVVKSRFALYGQKKIQVARITMNNALWNYLGYKKHIGLVESYIEQRIEQYNKNPTPEYALWGADELSALNLDDCFIVELDNLPLDCYDASASSYGINQGLVGTDLTPKTGRRKNILMTLPVNDNNGLVQYNINTPIYIDIRNTAPLLLKNLKLKVLRKDFSNIYTKGNESIITLLLDVGK